MGTTVTPNLGLIKPDGLEPIPNWPAQWGSNADALDNVLKVRKATYTPALTAVTTNPTNFTASGYFVRLWPNLVLVWVNIFMESGYTRGSGNYEISLPVALHSAIPIVTSTSGVAFGKAWLFDNSAQENSQTTVVTAIASNRVRLWTESGEANFVDEDTPFLWSQFDRLTFFMQYPTEAAW